MKKRLGFYLLYDENGVVDDYVPYFLKELKKFCDELCVVVNGDLNSKNKKKLTDVSDKVVERENVGLDAGAYKHIIELYGYDYLKNIDELIICNYTFFGPIHPLSEMFDVMEKRECDFWGINRHPALDLKLDGKYDIVEHIQSHFIVFRNSILKSEHFKAYWDTLNMPTNYIQAIANHELRLTKYFEDLGFKSTVYMDKYTDMYSGNSSIVLASIQITKDRCPILKRKVFAINNKCNFENVMNSKQCSELYNYIKNKTDYDFDLIAQNIVRTMFSSNNKYNEMSFKYLCRRTNIIFFLLESIKYNILYYVLPKNSKSKKRYNVKRKLFSLR